MKEFFKMFFASFLAMFISGFVLIIVAISMVVAASKSLMDRDNKIVSGNILTIDLGRHIHEIGQSNSLAALSNSSSFEAGLQDISKALDRAG